MSVAIPVKLATKLLDAREIVERVNAWGEKKYSDRVFSIDLRERRVELNPLYRVVYPPGSFVLSIRHFPGASVFWVERWIPETEDPHGLSFQGSARFGVCNHDAFDEEESFSLEH